MNLPQSLVELVDTATVRAHRTDPVLPRTGGPAGNAKLTAWIGLLLLALLAGELVTLLDVEQFISWHIAIGILLIPPALAKTASTGWRMVRYYMGARTYRTAGPPPLLLRVLGPFVVLTTLAVLGSGLALIPLGQQASRRPFMFLLGHDASAVTVHQGCFLVFGVVTGVHILARLLPAARLVAGSDPVQRIDGVAPRTLAVALTIAVGAAAAALVLTLSYGWTSPGGADKHAAVSRTVGVGVRP